MVSQKAATVRQTFPVLEMSCAACAGSVESMLRHTPGVSDVSVNYANASALVTYDPHATSPDALRAAVQSIGYDLVIDTEDPAQTEADARERHYVSLRRRTYWAIAGSVPVVVLGMVFMNNGVGRWVSLLLTAVVVFGLGGRFFQNAVRQARHGRANMDTLVALSTGIAFIFSAFNTVYPEFWLRRGLEPHVYFEAAAVVVAFVLLGKLLEERAKSSTSSAIRALIGQQPNTVRVADEQGERDIPLADVVAGQLIVVRPGEQIAVDGTVTAGESYVDESLISGEPVPVGKTAGQPVFAGTLNQRGSFRFRADKVGRDTLLAQIVRRVQEAQGSKAPVQQLVDKIAGVFVPVVLAIAVLTFVAWLGLAGDFAQALLTSVTVLVIACPCALGLATPTAIMVGMGRGAENQILIKDAESLELGQRVSTVVLDKTGTLTEGKPTVTDTHWAVPAERQAALRHVVAALESRSEHPLAGAVLAYLRGAANSNVVDVPIEQFESLTGRGIVGRHYGRSYYVGNARGIAERGNVVADDLAAIARRWQAQARTVVYVAEDEDVVALLAIADPVKPTSVAAVRRLQEQGITVHMLTGDNAATANAVAETVGIAHVVAEVLPEQKAQYVQTLQRQGHVVAMVGDGINDAPALAQADVSIAMGKGSDVAIDVARMTLMTTDLGRVPMALQLARRTVQTIRQNLFWAFIYNVVGIPIAAGVLYPVNGFLLNPMLAGAAMALSSVSVVTNSLRLRSARLGG